MQSRFLIFFVLIWVVALFVSCSVKSTKLQPILRLETGGHTGKIWDLIVSSNKKYLISCSNDKTIRVWDTETKKEVQKILGKIGEGIFGQIYAIALSPDDRYLAVGGFLSKCGIGNLDMGSIRIYHFSTGELIRILKSHYNVVSDLAFSPDGLYLVSGSHDHTVKVWDALDKFKLVHTFSEHTDHVNAVRIFPHQGDYRVVSAANDHEVIVYSLKLYEKLSSIFLSSSIRFPFLTVSKGYIACSGSNDNKINIFDPDLTHIKTIQSETNPTGLAFSPDGKLLLAGTARSPLNCNIYATEQNFKNIQSFQKHGNFTLAVAFFDNATAVTGGGYNQDIWFWDPRTGKTKDHIHIVGNGKRIYAVGLKKGEIAYGNTHAYRDLDHNDRGPLQRAFNLSDFQLFKTNDFSKFNRISTRYRDYTLSHTRGGPYGYRDAVLLVKKEGEVVSRIERDATNGYVHRCYGFTPNGVIISGGSSGHLKAYNTDGEEVADFAGHTGEVWAIALDGDWLISAGDDMVIHAWDLQKLRKGQTLISPSFSVFVSNDDQWVVWTPEGFFNASKGGAKYIGYHINRGKENAAEYIGVEQLYDLFYRPDLVTKRIQGGYENGIRTELARVGDIDKIIQSGLPPKVQVLDASVGKLTSRDFTLKLKLEDKGGGIGKVVFRVNGVEIGTPEGAKPMGYIGMKSSGVIHKRFTLKDGKNEISATAYNKDGNIESNPVELLVNVDDAMSREPDLYGLCIGISKYRDRALQLNYAAADAFAVKNVLETRAASLFREVHVRTLTDRQATMKGIEAAFKEISRRIRPNDVFVLYMSGHGKTLNANYHFIPYEMRYENEDSIRKQSFSYKKMQKFLSMIPALKSLVILDTCYAGSVPLTLAKRIVSKGMEEKTAIDRLMKATGRHTLAATSDTALAYEHKGHGIFTYFLLEGLKVHADRKGDGNGATGIDELADFLGDEVPRITFDKFGFEMVPMRNIFGDPFDIGCREGYDGRGCKP